MVAAVSLDNLGVLMGQVAEAARARLKAAGRPPQAVIDVAPGVTPAWDSQCSQLYGRVVQGQPNATSAQRAGTCGPDFYIVTLALALTRCVATVSDGGKRIKLPSAAEVQADGLTMVADMRELEQAIRCHPLVRSVVSVLPLPEAGGLAGIEWQYTVRVMPCPCAEAEG